MCIELDMSIERGSFKGIYRAQIGNGITRVALSPVPTCDGALPSRCEGPLSHVVADDGDDTTCAVTLDGRVLCWGSNGGGALGIGEDPVNSLFDFPYPVEPCISGSPFDGT